MKYVLLFLAMAPAFAGEGREASLKALEMLVGGSWQSAFPGGQATDTQVFEWVYDKQFIRNTHFVRDANGKTVYEGETIWAWDHKNQRLMWFYYNATGGHLIGHADYADKRFDIEGVNNAPGGQTAKIKATMIMKEDSWQSIQYFDKNGKWEEQFTMEFKRVKE